ncbi:hypothetical protein KQY30_32200 [Streptomyces sp. GMY02]|uniref:hypothetical protein n=1 Tax=Streptomyces sp. GMY02 TaxID=1333528 RepID=UPI001C2C143C|nr:hypothetical protein [Streptomyces sp. GMY02]QXE38201.1 hypothetical protein KQY30_32200 [Streptomyces sp. GMY02]
MKTAEQVTAWIFVGTAGSISLAGLVLVLAERARRRRRTSVDVRRVVLGAFLSLLGLAGLLRKLPALLDAPTSVVLACDALSLVVMLAIVVPLLRNRPRGAARRTSGTDRG